MIKYFSLRRPNDWKFWVTLSLLVKGTFFIFLIRSSSASIEGFWGLTSGDTNGYLNPIEQYLKDGNYLSTHRMPGYGFFYLPLIYLFSKPIALNILITVQYLLSAISVYFLALLALKIFNKLKFFYLVFCLFLFSTYSNFYDHIILTESLTCSLLIFSTYFLIHACKNKRPVIFFISGLLLTEVIFLRPVLAPILFLFLFIVFLNKGIILKEKLLQAAFFLSSFILADAVWTKHNIETHGRIQLLIDSFLGKEHENDYYKPVLHFIQSWGGDYISWKKGTHFRFFGVGINETGDRLDSLIEAEKISFPDYIFTSKFNIDSLEKVKDIISEIKANNSNPWDARREEMENYVKMRLNEFSLSIKQEKPFVFYIQARINAMKSFFITTRAHNPFNQIPYIKSFYNLFYFAIVLLGITGTFMLLFRYRSNIFFVSVIGIILYIILIHPFYLLLIENRFLLPAFPFLILTSGYLIGSFWGFNKKDYNRTKIRV